MCVWCDDEIYTIIVCEIMYHSFFSTLAEAHTNFFQCDWCLWKILAWCFSGTWLKPHWPSAANSLQAINSIIIQSDLKLCIHHHLIVDFCNCVEGYGWRELKFPRAIWTWRCSVPYPGSDCFVWWHWVVFMVHVDSQTNHFVSKNVWMTWIKRWTNWSGVIHAVWVYTWS